MKYIFILIPAVIVIAAVSAVFLFGSEKPFDPNKPTIEVFFSPTCGCCKNYIQYLQSQGFNVKQTLTSNPESVKIEFSVPASMQSCHTAKIGNYFIEGHVPVEAIQKLLTEQPAIDGIALPGMPDDAPGMGGFKTRPFKIYSISDGKIGEFMEV